jgi:hypothetical protein
LLGGTRGDRTFQGCTKIVENAKQFAFINGPGNVMSDSAPDDFCFDGGQVAKPIFNKRFGDGGKCVPVVEKEWRGLATLAADIQRFGQRRFVFDGEIPGFAGFGEGLFVDRELRLLFLASRLINFEDTVPWDRFEPLFPNAFHSLFFRRFLVFRPTPRSPSSPQPGRAGAGQQIEACQDARLRLAAGQFQIRTSTPP